MEEVNALPAARPATREELYRRLHYAKDYADAFFTTQITLDDMAQTAGLSANHLLRMFRQAFHQSPYQYIISRRLEHAQHLLRQTDQTVTDICLAVGFESLGSFSWLFRRRTGLSPLGYRLQNR
jgi:AraC-like DNA-binding protein